MAIVLSGNLINMKKVIFFACIVTMLFLSAVCASADSGVSKAVTYLQAKQDTTTGQITGGSTGDASPWAAIAFASNSIDPVTVKNGLNSLLDYLLNAHPTTSSAATEWEKWILAITASKQNPYNFGGVNYVTTLKSSTYYTNGQFGDATTATDDWFGILALISAGVDKVDPVLTNSLSFILVHQNTDGGFGYAITAGSDGNDTAAAIQALVAAKNYGVTNAKLDGAISRAKTYFLTTQDKSGGFLYDTNPWTTAPDSDSTTWALMALNVLGLKDSTQATNAKTWLLTQQASDGGFTACNQWDPNTGACTGYASNSTTTSHALIALSGSGWITTIFDPATVSPTPISSLTPTPSSSPSATLLITPTLTPAVSSAPLITISPTPVLVTNTIIITTTPAPVLSTPTPYIVYVTVSTTPTIVPATPTPAVLGVKTERRVSEQINPLRYILPTVFATLGTIFLGIFSWEIFLKKKLFTFFSK